MLNKPKFLTKLLTWLKAQVKHLLSTQTKEEKNASSLPLNQPGIQSNNTYHQGIEKLPYSVFLQVMTTGDVRHLIIEGNPSDVELTMAWYEIQYQYSDSVRTPKTDSILQLSKKILDARWRMSFVDLCVFILKKGYNREPAEALVSLGYSLVEDLPEWDSYLMQVYQVETEAKFLIIQLNQYNNEYKKLCPESDAIQSRTMIDYEKELRILSKFMGYSIKKDQITTMEFCSILNAYIEHIESRKNVEQ